MKRITFYLWLGRLRSDSFRRMANVVDVVSLNLVRAIGEVYGVKGKKGGELSLDDYEKIIYVLDEENLDANAIDEILKIFFGVDGLTWLNYWEVIGMLKYVFDELRTVKEMFEKLGGDDDIVWIEAGGDKLKKYGFWNIRITLGEKFGTMPNKIGKLEVSEIFIILAREHEKAMIEKRYFELKNK